MKKSSDLLPRGAVFKRSDSRTVLKALLATAAPNSPATETHRHATTEGGCREATRETAKR